MRQFLFTILVKGNTEVPYKTLCAITVLLAKLSVYRFAPLWIVKDLYLYDLNKIRWNKRNLGEKNRPVRYLCTLVM